MAAVSWVDSHCHVQDFEDVDDAVDRAVAAGVERMVAVGTDAASSRRAVELARRRPEVWASVGLHPHEASRWSSERDAVLDLVDDPRVVAVGESGFDLHYRHSPEEDQEAAFRAHVALAHRTGKALVIHTREAWEQTFDVLVDEGTPPRTVFHCFTGGAAEAARALELGAWLSFSGIVTFSNADDVREAAREVPASRLLVETDAPFLAPEPHRGKRNEPAHVRHVGERLASEVLDRDVGALAGECTAAAEAVFGW